MPQPSKADTLYTGILREIMDNGERRETRTGTDALSVFGLNYWIDLQREFPILTTKAVPFRLVAAEYLWFLSGQAHVNELREETSIWDSWANDEGFVETAYGRYWRRYPLPMDPSLFNDTIKDGEKTYRSDSRRTSQTPYEPFANRDSKYVHLDNNGHPAFDQIEWLVDQLRENPESRRMNVTAWYPPNATVSRLPPCHHTWTVSTVGGRLNIDVFQRSGDIPVGVPFNMTGYALVAHLLAKEVGMEVGMMRHSITDAHIYADQIEGVEEQLSRKPTCARPELVLPDKSLFELTPTDADKITLNDYVSRDRIRFSVAV